MVLFFLVFLRRFNSLLLYSLSHRHVSLVKRETLDFKFPLSPRCFYLHHPESFLIRGSRSLL